MILLPRAATVAVVLLATAILFLGHSLLTALLGFRAHLEGFGTTLTGAMMSVYFLGYRAFPSTQRGCARGRFVPWQGAGSVM